MTIHKILTSSYRVIYSCKIGTWTICVACQSDLTYAHYHGEAPYIGGLDQNKNTKCTDWDFAKIKFILHFHETIHNVQHGTSGRSSARRKEIANGKIKC